MEAFRIEGPKILKGDITPQGAKNEALQILAATLITKEEVVINNLPNILDLRNQIVLLEGMGVKIEWKGEHAASFRAADIDLNYLSSKEYQNLATRIRGSVLFLGPLLARFGQAVIVKPGGDKIGRRRIDTHLQGLMALGASVDYDHEKETYILKAEKLKGKHLLLDQASVTGTANIIMAAALAEGTTTIYHAACEPYIQQLCALLNSMGASISGAGTNRVIIEGVSSLGSAEHTCLPDMIEVGSFIGLAATTRSDITIKNAGIAHLGPILPTFKQLGIAMEVEGDDIHVKGSEPYQVMLNSDGSSLTFDDAPWPGFTPDLLSIVLVAAIYAEGTTLIHQKMFESRLFFVDNLIDMGAHVLLCDPHRAVVMGSGRKNTLKGIRMRSPDIRAGVALLIAALSAEGTSTILNISQIDRGYQDIEGRLNKLGAGIERLNLAL